MAEAVYDALFSGHPKLRYLVATKWETERLIDALIERMLDENDNPALSYDRHELIDLLDKQISKRQRQPSGD